MHESDDLEPMGAHELAGLPRRQNPGRRLEERTVAALRARGLLRPAGPGRAWWLTAAAAAVAIFASGYAIGQRSASLAFFETTVESQQRVAMQAALQVQRTGSAWISALNALSALSDDGDADAVRQGREAARSALRAAAIEFAAMAPSDPVSARLLWLLADPAEEVGEAEARTVIWF